MSAATYAWAAVPDPYRILSLRLKPFSLGHYLILARFDSAFVDEGEREATREELLFAVLVCSMTHEEWNEFVFSKDIAKEMAAWGKAVGFFDLKEKTELFMQYMTSGSRMPKYWNKEKDEHEPSGAHWSHSVLLALTGELGYTRSEALNAPLVQAFADYLKHGENNGAVRLMTDSEIELVAEAERQEKEATSCPA